MDASWFEPIRAYCERTDASYWAEPVNALSNGAFLVAAAAALRISRDDTPAKALACLVGVVGIGSYLFHTHANAWSMLADVVPIGLFILAYFGLAMHRFLGLSRAASFGGAVLFAGFNFGLGPALDVASGRSIGTLTNGSIDYAPAALALFGVGAAMTGAAEASRAGRVLRDGGRTMLAIGALFVLSLILRTADAAVCLHLPLGTHFLWHMANAGVLYGLIAVAVRVRPARI